MANQGFFAVGKTLNFGYPGNVSRLADAIIENRPVDASASSGIEFGAAVVLNAANNSYEPFGASNVAADFAGIAVREVHQSTDYLNSYSNGFYAANQPCDVMERGSATVTCTEGTPTAGGAVYIVTTAGTVSPVGSLTATSTISGAGVAVQLTNCQWKTGAIDANNTSELTILSRNKA